MSTVIADHSPGRGAPPYDLLQEVTTRYPELGDMDAHDAVWQVLEDLTSLGEDWEVDREPVDPIAARSGRDRDRRHWITITEDAADSIREALAATHDEQWTTADIAERLGIASSGVASWLRRAGVTPVRTEPSGGRGPARNVYGAGDVRWAAAQSPGQGARTDLR